MVLKIALVTRAQAQELLGREVASCEPRAGGENSAVYQVRFACQAEPVVVKRYQQGWERAKEVHVYRLLAGQGIVRLPRMLAPGDDYAVLSMVPGRPLWDVSDSMDAAQRFAVYRQIGEFLARLHEITMDAFGYLVTKILDPEPDNTGYMTGRFDAELAKSAVTAPSGTAWWPATDRPCWSGRMCCRCTGCITRSSYGTGSPRSAGPSRWPAWTTTCASS